MSAAVEPGWAAKVVEPRDVLCGAVAAIVELKRKTFEQVSAAVEPGWAAKVVEPRDVPCGAVAATDEKSTML